MSGPRPSQAGFSLLEVLVAFAILALALGVLLQTFSTGLRNADLSAQYSYAALLAQSKLASVGVEEDLHPGATSGRFDDRYHWRLRVSPYQDDAIEPEETSELRRRQRFAGDEVKAYQVELTVEWEDEGQQRELTLDSLRIARRERP